jgi:protein TonB
MSKALIPVFSLLALLTASGAYAQSISDTSKNKKAESPGQVYQPAPPAQAYTYVEQMPEYPGGNAAMQQYLADHIQYPEQAKKAEVQGRVYVSIVIDKDGNVTDATVVKDAMGYGLGAEAIRVIKQMPKWKSGKQNGMAVPVKLTIPVTFSLQ